MNNKISYRIDEAVQATGIGRTTLYKLIERGDLETFKIGKRTLILGTVLTDFIQRQAQPAGAG